MAGLSSSGYSSSLASTIQKFGTSEGAYKDLATEVHNTFEKLVTKNKNKRNINDVCEWASGQIRKVVERTLMFSTNKIVREEEEKERQERAAAQQRELEDMIRLMQENQNKVHEEDVEDNGTEIIEYPWEKIKYLGKGAFGVVHLATDKNGFKFAVKAIDTDGVEASSIEDEIECLTQLNHENIVRCYGSAKAEQSVYIYLELLEGSIRDKLNKQKKPIKEAEAKHYTRHILRGLIFLHKRDMVHRDIKSANVLLDKGNNAKLADMGLVKAHRLETASMYNNPSGTVIFMSPEVLTQEAEAGKRADVWSVGCTVYEMMKLWPPFYSEDLLSLFGGPFQDILAGIPIHQNLVNNDTELPVTVKSFLHQIFATLNERPYAEGIVLHKWLRN